MEFLDIVFTVLLGYAIYTGLKNGLFVEIASFCSLVIGIYFAIKFSYLVRLSLDEVIQINPKYIQFIAFSLTFLGVVIGIHLLAKFFTGLASFASLGWLNKLGGAVFSLSKTIVMLSVVINLFQKININNFFIKEETLKKSLFYYSVQDVSAIIYPSLEKHYEEFKGKMKSENENKRVSDSIIVE